CARSYGSRRSDYAMDYW
nr:immunoglobulin heavy chain junction region [Mus musculus]